MPVIYAMNFDEISSKLHSALPFFEEQHLSYCEIRLIDNRNIAFITNEECMNLKRFLDSHELMPISIASPINRWYATYDERSINQEHYGVSIKLTENEKMKLIDEIFSKAKILNVKRIRVFSNIGTNTKQSVDELIESNIWKYILKKAIEEDIIILLENESICTINSLSHLQEFIDKTKQYANNVKLWVDIANLIQVGDHISEDNIKKIAERIGYIHIKDFVCDNNKIRYVPVGDGEINYEKILRLLFKFIDAKKDVILSIETHAGDDRKKYTYSSKSINAIKNIIKNIMEEE